MADMILTRLLLDTKYASWFHSKRNTEQTKQEILSIFFQEPDEGTKPEHSTDDPVQIPEQNVLPFDMIDFMLQ